MVEDGALVEVEKLINKYDNCRSSLKDVTNVNTFFTNKNKELEIVCSND